MSFEQVGFETGKCVEINATINSVAKALMHLNKDITGREAYSLAVKSQNEKEFKHYKGKSINHVNIGDKVGVVNNTLIVTNDANIFTAHENDTEENVSKREDFGVELDKLSEHSISNEQNVLEVEESNEYSKEAIVNRCIDKYLLVKEQEGDPEPTQYVKKAFTNKMNKYWSYFKNSFPESELETAITVSMLESSLHSSARLPSSVEDSRGLLQVNSLVHKDILRELGMTVEDLYDPEKNIKVAAVLQKRKGWQPWSAYTRMKKQSVV